MSRICPELRAYVCVCVRMYVCKDQVGGVCHRGAHMECLNQGSKYVHEETHASKTSANHQWKANEKLHVYVLCASVCVCVICVIFRGEIMHTQWQRRPISHNQVFIHTYIHINKPIYSPASRALHLRAYAMTNNTRFAKSIIPGALVMNVNMPFLCKYAHMPIYIHTHTYV